MESLYLCSLSVSDLLQDLLIVLGPILAKCCVYKENLSSDPNKSTCWDLRGYHAGLLGISAMRGQILYSIQSRLVIHATSTETVSAQWRHEVAHVPKLLLPSDFWHPRAKLTKMSLLAEMWFGFIFGLGLCCCWSCCWLSKGGRDN